MAVVRVGAGGWSRLEFRALRGKETLAVADVKPIGVGEVFVIAGQSYAAGANEELIKIDDPQGRVVAYDVVKKSWQVANDPQPNVGDGGTIWPSFGNYLQPILRVPIGLVNVAAGGHRHAAMAAGRATLRTAERSGKKPSGDFAPSYGSKASRT